MSRRTIIFGLMLAGLAVTGCHTCHKQKCSARPCDSCNSNYQPPPRLRPVPYPAPLPAPPRQPPIARLDPPSQAGYLAPQTETPPARHLPEAPGERDPNPPEPPGDFPPAGPPATLGPPQAPSPYRRDVAKAPDEPLPKGNVPNPLPREDRTQPRLSNEDRLNVNAALPDVKSGLKPFDLEDFKWLAKQRYAAVLNLRDAGGDDTVTRRVTQRQGMTYHTLVASAATLDVELYEDFVKIVDDTKNYPLYVYDKDGTVAGGLWYLYYRLERKDDDATARAKAKKLGLNFDDEAHRDMVLAVQKVLAKLKP